MTTPDAASELPAAPPDGAVKLATKLSIAVRIEPELLRAMRLTALPTVDVSAEADLWFSRWVRTRGADGIVLLPAVRTHLQERLAAELAAQMEEERQLVWETLARVHESISPALQLEERVAWLVARYRQAAVGVVDEALRPALRSLVVEGRTGVADWFGRAWERLPEVARGTLTAWQLAQVSASLLPGRSLPVTTVPPDLAATHLTDIVDVIKDVRLGVRRDGPNLELGDVSGTGAVAILVPDTDPRLLEVQPIEEPDQTPEAIAIRAGQSQVIRVGPGVVLIRTARGHLYQIAPSAHAEPRLDQNAPALTVAFATTPDGRLLLASAGGDQTVRLWDPVTGTLLAQLTGHTGAVNSVAFGTTASGQLLLASAGGDQTVRLWDPVTGTPVGPPLTGHTGAVNSVAFGTTASGQLLLASAGGDQTVRLWDPVTGTPVGPPLTGHTGAVNSVAFGTTASGQLLLASAGGDQTVRLWDPVTGTPVGPPLTGHTGAVNSVAFGTTASGQLLLASAGGDQTVRLWNPVTGTPVSPPLTGHAGAVNSVAFGTTPDGRLLLASAGGDQTVRLWDPVTGTLLAQLTGHTSAVSAVAFFGVPDGRLLLASAGDDGTVRIWDPAAAAQQAVLQGHQGKVSGVCPVTVAGRELLASAGDDGTVRIWDPAAAAQQAVLQGHQGKVSGVCPVTVAGRELLASAGDDGTVRIWDPAAAAQQAVLQGHQGKVSGVCPVTVAGRELLASAGDDGTVRIWDPAAAAQQAVLQGHQGKVSGVCPVTVAGRELLASAGDDGTVRIWDPAAAAQQAVLQGHQGKVSGVCPVTVAGRELLASAGDDGTVRIWDPAAAAQQAVLQGHQGKVSGVCPVTVAGRELLASAGDDGTVRIWDPAAAAQQAVLQGHQGKVSGVCPVTVAGRELLASAGDNGTVRIWDPATGALLAQHDGLSALVSVIAADGRLGPVSDSADATVRVRAPVAAAQVQETPRSVPRASVVDHPARARVAEIMVSRVGKEDTRGSGYLVSVGWVLTAHHVVQDAASVGVWLGAPPELAPEATIGVDIGRVLTVPAADLALLPVGAQADDPLGEPALFGRLDRDPGPPVPVVAAGFPRFKLRPAPDRPGVLLRELDYAIGSITPLSEAKTNRFALAVDAVPGPDSRPDKHSPWEGMSGAAVWANGRLIGVIGQHHPPEGLATLTVCPIEQLFGFASKAELNAWRTALPQLPPIAEGLWLTTLPAVRKIELPRARRAAEALAPRVLIDRSSELATLEELAGSDARWLWIQGDAFAGKTALLAWFALHPPERIDVAACFLRRTIGSNTADYALDLLNRQLALLANRPSYRPPPFLSEQANDFIDLLDEAARACAERGRRLLVLIDGLDEYESTTGLDLAAWLPDDSTLPDHAMLLVASRAGADVRLPRAHPLSSNVQRISASGAGSAEQADNAGLVTTKAASRTLVVDDQQRGDFATISAAIQAAKPGDRILVRSGLYEAGLVVEKPLELSVSGKAAADLPIITSGRDAESLLLALVNARREQCLCAASARRFDDGRWRARWRLRPRGSQPGVEGWGHGPDSGRGPG